jgi:hypothetical protein
VVNLTEVLHGELLLQSCDDALPELHRGRGEYEVIHIGKEIRRVRSSTKHEQAGVGLGFHKSECQQECGEETVPGSGGLLQAIHGLVETTDEAWVSRVLKPSGLRTESVSVRIPRRKPFLTSSW